MSQSIEELIDPIHSTITRMKAQFDSMTPEEKAEMERIRQQYLRDIETARAMSLIAEAQVPIRHSRATIKHEGAWKKNFDGIVKMVASGFLVALVGTRGNGKTQMAVELIREFAKRGMGSRYMTVMQLLMEIKATYRPNSFASEGSVINALSAVSFLVIDEFAKRGETEWENRVMFELIDRRYRNMKDTLLIANQTQEEFTTAIGPSLASRMTETGGMVKCDWESFRS